MAKKLYKSSKNKMIFGVCGGLAEYFNIDVTIVRIIFVILGFFSGSGIVIYIITGLIMPSRDRFSNNYENDDDVNNMKSANINKDDNFNSKNNKNNRKEGSHSDEDFNNFFKK